TPQIDTHGVGAPQIDTHLSTPQIDTPQIDTPQIDTVQPDNGTDVTYTVTNGGTTNSVYKVGFNVTNVEGLINSGNYQFIVIVSKVSLAMSVQNTGAGCTPAAQPRVQVLANIPVTATTIAQLATLKNPQIDTTTVPDIATFTVAPFGGVAGLNGAAATTDASGVATFPNLAVTGAGSGYVLYARVGDNVLGTSVPFNIVAGPLTFVVSNANDSGAGSLRQAIIEANANAPFAD